MHRGDAKALVPVPLFLGLLRELFYQEQNGPLCNSGHINVSGHAFSVVRGGPII